MVLLQLRGGAMACRTVRCGYWYDAEGRVTGHQARELMTVVGCSTPAQDTTVAALLLMRENERESDNATARIVEMRLQLEYMSTSHEYCSQSPHAGFDSLLGWKISA